MDRIKRISNEVLKEYSERFGTDFLTNKQSLNEISVVRSKGLKNKIAGYITKMLQRQAKFEERKQMIIDNEKKSQEHKESTTKKSKPAAEPAAEPEHIATNEKTVAEEIVDESKSE
ncbi:hypothetical protein OAJ83_03220 [Candidatus Nitrosopelagicus sp.]|nr:hypothetical protein [Candidatus Nitrosopelagicus sp.]